MVLSLKIGVCESLSENMKVVEQIFKYNKFLIQFKISNFNGIKNYPLYLKSPYGLSKVKQWTVNSF